MVEELITYTPQDLTDLDALMHELSSTSYCNKEILDRVMGDDNSHVYVIREDGHIVATGTLCVMHTLEFTIASIESVVVNSNYRGRGYSRELMKVLISFAKEIGVHHLHLTSNPKRVAANKLYQSLGFELYKTNCYRLIIQN